ncbi:hypothetical protein ACI75Y_06905 [Capnocytophaga stomatis]|uniref:capsular polysaccharide export protein, LipB/KpsS family n=1 Tax=Capnocytophaga stomatis TaxID=1848904 RepID=UPI003859859D
MKILFFFTAHPRLEMIFKIQSEILTKHVLKGDEVYIVVDFESDIVKSQVNYNSVKSSLYYYKTMFHNMLEYLHSKGGRITVIDYKPIKKLKKTLSFDSLSELKSYTFEEYGLGMCAASSLISRIRDHHLDTGAYIDQVNRELNNSIDVFTTIKHYHNTIAPNLVYLFNGRMSIYAPIVLYCEKNNLSFKTFEFSFSFDKYHLLHNKTPHDREYMNEEIKFLWNDKEISLSEKQEIGVTFFENQRGGISTVEQSYIGLQNKEVEEAQLKGKEVITFFNSSTDEFAAVPGWEDYMYVYDNEVDAIFNICQHYRNDKSKIFTLRIHPNLKFIDNTQNRELLKLKQLKNLIVFEAHSPIRSYSLLDKSDKVITFGSTIGVEACYYGKPVICLGLSFYENLDVAYIPKNKEELFCFLNDKNLQPKPKENALPYGYWFCSFGEPFSNHENGNITEEKYALTKKQRQIGLLKKVGDLGSYKRALKVLNPKNDIFKKLKDPSFRRNLYREFAPWRIK